MRTTLFRLSSVAAMVTLSLTGVTATASAQESSRDLMFAIDTTGSMGGYIDETKTAVDEMATDLASEGSGTRVGLVEYRDDGDAFQSRTVQDLTFNLDPFRAGLDGLVVDGGGDEPESVYSGIARALCQDWSSSAVKAVIAIGDAPAKDPEPVTGLTAERIIALANGTATDNPYCASASAMARAAGTTAAPADGTPIYLVTANGDLAAQFAAITEATGGSTVPVENIDEVGDAIKDTVGEIDEDIVEGGGLIGSIRDLFGS